MKLVCNLTFKNGLYMLITLCKFLGSLSVALYCLYLLIFEDFDIMQPIFLGMFGFLGNFYFKVVILVFAEPTGEIIWLNKKTGDITIKLEGFNKSKQLQVSEIMIVEYTLHKMKVIRQRGSHHSLKYSNWVNIKLVTRKHKKYHIATIEDQNLLYNSKSKINGDELKSLRNTAKKLSSLISKELEVESRYTGSITEKDDSDRIMA